eukprot:CAMPEP_0180676642 /NCGR_PEP_ID=MMETSP1037_2-20121125/67430_1 /TAXON_ID=632150 /ORGANISM="Azadinium spinosum, Strain 3D9" /LENGTH=57 /DNA_ID=CAMNT_0022706177 /DNA_START=197 /DNA_END=367 /DNA_ORIENTATION=+
MPWPMSLEVRAHGIVLIHEESQCIAGWHVERYTYGVELVEPELAEGVWEDHRSEEFR